MRVYQIGNHRHSHCTEVHLRLAMERRGWDITPAQEDEAPTWEPPDDLDTYDFVLWTRTWNLPQFDQRGFLDACANAGVPTVGYHLDRWWGLVREHQVDDEPFFGCDLMVTADGGHDELWELHGIDHVWFPPAVLEQDALLAPRPSSDYLVDIAFVGSHKSYHPEWAYRMELVNWLTRTYRKRVAFWPRSNRSLRHGDLNALYQTAKVIVGDSCLAGSPNNYWSDRIPETTGRGGFLIHPDVPGLSEAHPHLVTYPIGDFVRLRELIDYYLRHEDERLEIAARNRAHTLAHHTYEIRMGQLEELLMARELITPLDEKTGLVAVANGGIRAKFILRPDTTDGIVVREQFAENTYGLKPSDVANRTVLDIGANIGSFTIWAAKAGAAGVIAYEPDPENYKALQDNISVNGDMPVVAFNLGVSGSGGHAHLIGSSGGVQTVADADGDVELSSIEHVLEYATHVDIIKMDCEGAEYSIIGGMGPREFAAVDRIVMEYHNSAGACGEGVMHPDWPGMIAKLAQFGHVRILGRPAVGGLIWWSTYR